MTKINRVVCKPVLLVVVALWGSSGFCSMLDEKKCAGHWLE